MNSNDAHRRRVPDPPRSLSGRKQDAAALPSIGSDPDSLYRLFTDRSRSSSDSAVFALLWLPSRLWSSGAERSAPATGT